MTTEFEDFFYEWASTRASELVGPNSAEYESLSEKILDDPEEEALARKEYDFYGY